MNNLKKTLSKNKKPILIFSAVLAVVVLFLGGSFLSLVHNKLELKRLQKLTLRLDAQHEQLQQEYELLQKQDLAYIERIARVKYNMVKNGEVEFRLKKK